MKVIKSRRALLAALLALALPLTLAACGSDDGDTEATAQEESTEEETTEEETPASEDAEGEEIHVVAKDFMFEGIPETLPAGSYSFHLENQGEEEHELALFKINTDTPVEELIKLPEEKAMKQITPVGGTFAEPGGTSEEPLAADLESGTYAAVCFIPNKKGPHAFQGMVHEFTVE